LSATVSAAVLGMDLGTALEAVVSGTLGMTMFLSLGRTSLPASAQGESHREAGL
jgi:hypothetical protein